MTTTEGFVKTAYRIYLPNGPVAASHEVDWPREPGLDLIRGVVMPVLNGGELEHVSVWADFYGTGNFWALDMFVDEMGVSKGLPRNYMATHIYRVAVMMGKTPYPAPVNPEDLHCIYGPAVLFDRRVWF